MKIAIAINTTWNIYNFRLGLIKALQKEGHEIITIAPKDEYVSKLESYGSKHYHIDIDQQGTNPFSDARIIKSYNRIFKNVKPDIILSYTIKPNVYGNLAARKLKIPVINNISGLGTIFIKKSLFSLIGKLLYKISLKNSSWTFFQNMEDRALFINSKLVKKNRSNVIPGSGVDTSRFKINRTKNNGKRFLFVGRLIGDKGIYEYLKAAENISNNNKNIEFLIVGELGYNNNTALSKHELELWLQNPNIKYLGKRDDMDKVYKEIDVMVLPSYREGLSKSLIEAASMSLPIITTDVPGCRDVVENGENGFLCKVKDFTDLQMKIEKMITLSENERLQMGLNSRNKAELKFDESFVINQYKNKIKEIVQIIN